MNRLLDATGILGFRWWRFDRDGELRSPLRTFVRWAPGMNTARCLASGRLLPWRVTESMHGGHAPAGRCTCGFYGLHDIEAGAPSSSIARAWRRATSASGGPEAFVLGIAEGWGRAALEHTWWRAEFARVRALYVANRRDVERVEPAARRYGVPVYRDLEAFIGEWRPATSLAQVA
jgi:hypothetical protein